MPAHLFLSSLSSCCCLVTRRFAASCFARSPLVSGFAPIDLGVLDAVTSGEATSLSLGLVLITLERGRVLDTLKRVRMDFGKGLVVVILGRMDLYRFLLDWPQHRMIELAHPTPWLALSHVPMLIFATCTLCLILTMSIFR